MEMFLKDWVKLVNAFTKLLTTIIILKLIELIF